MDALNGLLRSDPGDYEFRSAAEAGEEVGLDKAQQNANVGVHVRVMHLNRRTVAQTTDRALEPGERKRVIDAAREVMESADRSADEVQGFQLREVKLLAPLTRPSKFVCVGLNYVDHAAESQVEVPKEPVFFSKYPSSIVGPEDSVVKPAFVTELDYEVELGVVIGKRARNVGEEEALDYVFGFTRRRITS